MGETCVYPLVRVLRFGAVITRCAALNSPPERSRYKLLQQFMEHPGRVGAIAPSSAALARAFVDHADLGTASTIVELGPGTGALTRHLVPAIQADATFLAIELNEDLVRLLRSTYPEVSVHHASAIDLRACLATHGRSTCDRVISSLPWATFPEPLQDAILGEVHASLEPGGRFLTFAYVSGLMLRRSQRFRKQLRLLFDDVEVTPVVWRNLPPAVIYCATR